MREVSALLLLLLFTLGFSIDWKSFDRGVWACYDLLTKRQKIKFRSYLLCDGADLSFVEKVRLREVVSVAGKEMVVSGNSIFIGDFPDPKDAEVFALNHLRGVDCQVENRSIVVKHEPNLGRSAKFKYSIYDLRRALEEMEALVRENIYYNEVQKRNILKNIRQAVAKLEAVEDLISEAHMQEGGVWEEELNYSIRALRNAPVFDEDLRQKGIVKKGTVVRAFRIRHIGGVDYYEIDAGLVRVRDFAVVE